MNPMTTVITVAATVAAIVAIALIILAALAASKRFYRQSSGLDQRIEKASKLEKDANLPELWKERDSQESSFKRNKFSSNALKIGQYLLGTILASAFIQETIPGPVTGALGVLVLFATVSQQHFRPDVVYRGSHLRMALLDDVERRAKNDLFKFEKKEVTARSIYEIREEISEVLKEVDEKEIEDLIRQLQAATVQADMQN